jgi:hypothetical protein
MGKILILKNKANMGSIYLKLGDKEKSYKCIQEALKNSNESWKLWENFM